MKLPVLFSLALFAGLAAVLIPGQPLQGYTVDDAHPRATLQLADSPAVLFVRYQASDSGGAGVDVRFAVPRLAGESRASWLQRAHDTAYRTGRLRFGLRIPNLDSRRVVASGWCSGPVQLLLVHAAEEGADASSVAQTHAACVEDLTTYFPVRGDQIPLQEIAALFHVGGFAR